MRISWEKSLLRKKLQHASSKTWPVGKKKKIVKNVSRNKIKDNNIINDTGWNW